MANITLIGPGGLYLDQTGARELIVPLGIVQEQVAVPAALLSGTMVPEVTEAEVRAGGETLIITLVNATWVAAGATFDGIRQDLIDAIIGQTNPGFGWNSQVRPNIPVTAVVRTDDETVTITMIAHGTYDISIDQLIDVTVPASTYEVA
jgi:hypothetical protein